MRGTYTRTLIIPSFAPGNTQGMATATENLHMRLVPWAGVAACIRQTGPAGPPSSPLHPAAQLLARLGRAYCFLPLPAETQLPVHVNGYFELSSNRRDIWHGTDMAGDGKMRADWNLALITDIAVPCYTRLLRHAIKAVGPGSEYLSLWPTEMPPKPWDVVMGALYTTLADMRVLWSEVQGGCWISPRSAVLLRDTSGGGSSASGAGALVSPAQLHDILMQEGQPVVKLPPKLYDMLVQFECCAAEISPAFVRGLLKARGPHPCLMKRSNALLLLQYCLSDLSGGQYGELEGLKLIPLADGTLGTFESAVDEAGRQVQSCKTTR